MNAKSTNVFFTLAIKNWTNTTILFYACMCLKSVVQMKPLYLSSGKTLYSERIIVGHQCRLWHLSWNRGDGTNIPLPPVEFSLFKFATSAVLGFFAQWIYWSKRCSHLTCKSTCKSLKLVLIWNIFVLFLGRWLSFLHRKLLCYLFTLAALVHLSP